MSQAVPQVDETLDHDVDASLTFIVPQHTKPYFESSALTGGLPKTYFKTERHCVTIHDMRAIADGLSIDRQGFELRQHKTTVADLYDDDVIERVYNAELEEFLRHATGADRVVVFDHTRRSDAPDGAVNPDGSRGPAERVHVDYTVASGPLRAGDVLGAEEVEDVLESGGRIMQVNVWRPIKGPVRRTPLALADAATIAAADLIATDQVFPDRIGEIYQLAHAPTQRWYWASNMRRDEVILIKGWDSLDDGRARFTPHGAFRLPEQNDDDPPRESIETRTYLIFEN